jgi:hypothetical protein
MAFTYNGWTLYTRKVKLKGGRDQNIYFFSKKTPKSGEPSEMPEGYRVKEAKTKGSGMPYVTKH